MSTDFPPPDLEARVTALEQGLEKLKQEVASGFTRMLEHQGQAVNRIEARLTLIEASMATKEDMAAMEARILDTFKQLLTLINRPPTERTG